MKAIVIDDEPLAREILRDYINEFPEMECMAEFDSVLKASAWLETNSVDVIFLDIQMPRLTGIQWLKSASLQNNASIVITSAYSDYVSDSYELLVSDYLLKPISFNRFYTCVERLREKQKNQQKNDSLLIRVDKAWIVVDFESIMFVQGMGDYIKIHSLTKTFVTQETMKSFSDKLPKSTFFRVHKSYIVNKLFIERIEGNTIPMGKHEVLISPNYKDEFLNWLS